MKILIVDDHPLIINAYIQALKETAEHTSVDFEITTSRTIDEALELLRDNTFAVELDMLFLDIRLPKGDDPNFLSGEDIGIFARKEFPELKIIVITTFNDNYRIHSILNNIDPDGFLVKNDLTPQKLIEAIKCIIKDPPYYSHTVLKMLRKQISDEALLDNTDRRLLYELSIGTKMKDLPEILPLSKAGIEKRKRNLKLVFRVEDKSDRSLIEQARQRGFI